MNLKFTPQAYFIDLDRTLLDQKKHNISQKNLETIKKINEQVPVVLSTGRSPKGIVLEILNKANLKYAICQNGALIIDKNQKILQEHLIKKEVVKKIFKLVNQWKSAIIINSSNVLYTKHLIAKTMSGLIRKWAIKSQKKNNNWSHVRKIVIFNVFPWRTRKIFKKIEQIFPKLNLKISIYDQILEITNKNASKGLGNLFVSSLLNVDPKKTVHIGDSMNDATTIEYMGALIATKNASKRLLKVATHIAHVKHKNGGVTQIFKGYFSKNKDIKK